jgi:hypothetical protein
LLNIETGCAKELVLRLKTLRDEIATVSNQKMLSTNSVTSSYSSDSVENMVKQISHRVLQLVKQRETLQKAVNKLQGEKQIAQTTISH